MSSSPTLNERVIRTMTGVEKVKRLLQARFGSLEGYSVNRPEIRIPEELNHALGRKRRTTKYHRILDRVALDLDVTRAELDLVLAERALGEPVAR